MAADIIIQVVILNKMKIILICLTLKEDCQAPEIEIKVVMLNKMKKL